MKSKKKPTQKFVATIEARMTSSRLPGKVLLPVLDKPILSYLVQRLQAVHQIDEIVLATTVNPQDDVLEDFANAINISCFRGSEDDVMSRVVGAARQAKADIIVEITGDCPIIDYELVEQAISVFKHNDADYVSNGHVRSYPDGMDVQVFSRQALEKSASMTTDRLDREHVSLHMRNNPNIFKLINLIAPPSLYQPDLGLTLDEQADYELIQRIISSLYPKDNLFNCISIINYLDENPEIRKINQLVKRKGDT